MGRYKTHAKDGTPRFSDPKQDEFGNWVCPSCSKSSGFKSKHSVLGHLRFCGRAISTITEKPKTTSSLTVEMTNREQSFVVIITAIKVLNEYNAPLANLAMDALKTIRENA